MNAVLAGYGNIPTGLGSELRWLWKLLPFTTWIQAKHKKFEKSCGWGEPVPEEGLHVRRIVRYDWESVAKRADVIVCVERPLPEGMELLVRRYGKKLVILANPEWTSLTSTWLDAAHLIVARTELCERWLEKLGIENTLTLQVPMDLSEFPFRLRTSAQRVRFSNGWGGVYDRKGWPEVQRMLAIEPGSVEVFSQKDVGHGLHISFPESSDLYNGADVMLVPSRFEGVGLAVLEAMASGCIVMATDAEPMSQFVRAAYGMYADLCLLPVAHVEMASVGGQPWPANIIDPQVALHKIDQLRRSMDAPLLSAAGRKYVEDEHGTGAQKKLWEAITT